jgi:hypothetical protein
MRVPPFKRIDSQTDSVSIVAILNNFMDFVFRAFRKNLTFQENTPYQVVTLPFTTLSTYTIGEFGPLEVKVDPPRQVVGVLVLNSVPAAITETPRWVQEGGNVKITWLAGLADNLECTVTLLIV